MVELSPVCVGVETSQDAKITPVMASKKPRFISFIMFIVIFFTSPLVNIPFDAILSQNES